MADQDLRGTLKGGGGLERTGVPATTPTPLPILKDSHGNTSLSFSIL